MLVTIVLLALILVASLTDLLRHRIYNWTTYPGILAALCGNGIGEALLAAAKVEEGELQRLGWIGLGESLLGFLLCGFLMLVCFVMLKVGGGDVKLMAMLGAFLGMDQGITAMLWTFVLGACMALIVLIWRVGANRLASRVFRQAVYTLRLGRWSPLTDEERKQLQPPLFLAPCAAVAVVIVRFQLADLFM
ncbi:MAG TPA: A24 family peptidase [Thermoguttaceae bacterium]|nr:A24 family peptidase [Thermoguttaceae bacterium]